MKLLTDYFQSLRLVKSGLDNDTADYFFFNGEAYPFGMEGVQAPEFPYVPCWSMAALWDVIHRMVPKYEFPSTLSSDQLMEQMVVIIETAEPF